MYVLAFCRVSEISALFLSSLSVSATHLLHAFDTHVTSTLYFIHPLARLMFSMFGPGLARPSQILDIWLTAVRFEPNVENIRRGWVYR